MAEIQSITYQEKSTTYQKVLKIFSKLPLRVLKKTVSAQREPSM
jgi:hypothetical protein